jgi:hypothetical protein
MKEMKEGRKRNNGEENKGNCKKHNPSLEVQVAQLVKEYLESYGEKYSLLCSQ